MLRRPANCPTDAVLRAFIDSEEPRAREVVRHLESCADCRVRLAELSSNADFASASLARLAQDESEPNVEAALRKMRSRIDRRELIVEERNQMGRIWGRRSGRAATAVIGIFAILMAFTLTPLSSMADDFLDRFRVTKFAAITVDMEEFDEFGMGMLTRLALSDQDQLETAFLNLGDYTTTFDEMDPYANVTEYESADEASNAFGDFLIPGDVPDGYAAQPRFYGSEAGSVSVDINTAEAQAVIDELGLPIFSLPNPEQVPVMTFTMEVPETLVIEYSGATEDEKLMVVQMASPVLNTPAGLDMDALREDLLTVPGLPPDFVAQLRSIEDWQETLIVPVPDGASSEDVTVDGNAGLLVQADDGSGAMVLWEEDDRLIIVGGTESGDVIEEFARSLD